MCLTNLISQKALETFKKKLPDEFDVFKAVHVNGEPEYSLSGGDKLTRKGIHASKNKPNNYRMKITYAPGFHAFLSKRTATSYCSNPPRELNLLVIKKFRAKREWIITKGRTRLEDLPCIVLSKIKVV